MTPSDCLAVLGAGGASALLCGGDRHRAGVVEQRGLHPEEHHREQGRQQDHELDRHRAAFVPSAGYLMLPAWLVTYAFTAATTMPTMAMTATAQSTCSVVTEPRSSRRAEPARRLRDLTAK